MKNDELTPTERREFLNKLATGAAVAGLGMFATSIPSLAAEKHYQPASEAEAWFKKVKGTHKIVFDVTAPHDAFTFTGARIFLMTNQQTGTPEKDCGVVIILRHGATPFALNSSLWEKYKFGEEMKMNDPATKAPASRNPFWQPKAGDFKIPGIGEANIGIDQLQASGVMFCVCNAALTVHSAVLAKTLNLDADAVHQEVVAGVLPGIQIVPSGVWAVGRAQEAGCAYCFVG
jgi:intracellular sulfur oxidation DsrE/DsrF family protein